MYALVHDAGLKHAATVHVLRTFVFACRMWLGNAANPKCGEKMKTSTKDNAGGSATFNETFNFQKAENMDLLTVSRATITTHNTLVKKDYSAHAAAIAKLRKLIAASSRVPVIRIPILTEPLKH